MKMVHQGSQLLLTLEGMTMNDERAIDEEIQREDERRSRMLPTLEEQDEGTVMSDMEDDDEG